MTFQVDLPSATFEAASFRVDLQEATFTGSIVFQIDLAGPATFSGATYKIVPSTSTPESGERVVLAFAGDSSETVIWRVVSIEGNYVEPLIVVSSNLIANVRVPAVKTATALVIGAKQGSGVEQQITLTIQPTPHGYYREGGYPAVYGPTYPANAGTWTPASVEVYQ